MLSPTIALAPMMDVTHRHFRYFMRLMSKRLLLYTEMVHCNALLRGDYHRILRFDEKEHPVALQLGGSDPDALARSAQIAEGFGYDEVNLNVGCPSERVQQGRFGVCLMKQPELVTQCYLAMQGQVKIPITIKTRIGVDHCDSEAFLWDFLQPLAQAGCRVFIVHARKAWLNGLNPKQNRTLPPLNYQRVYRVTKKLKTLFPSIKIIINGGIETFTAIDTHLQYVDGVMIGRKAMADPYWFNSLDQRYFGEREAIKSPWQLIRDYLPYMEREYHAGTSLYLLTRPLFGLFQGLPGAKAWRKHLTYWLQKQTHDLKALLEHEPS